jgi:hypothetical protein
VDQHHRRIDQGRAQRWGTKARGIQVIRHADDCSFNSRLLVIFIFVRLIFYMLHPQTIKMQFILSLHHRRHKSVDRLISPNRHQKATMGLSGISECY